MTAKSQIIWDRHDQYIIRDVQEKAQERIAKYMLENHFIPHRLYSHMKYQEDPDVQSQYLKFVEHILRGEACIEVVDENTDNVHAIALAKCMTSEWRSWTALKLCAEPSKFTDIIELHYSLVKECAEDNPDAPVDTFHLFEYYMDDKLKNDYEFIEKFFNAIYNTAKILKMPRVTVVALSQVEQQICLENGYDPMNYAIYSIYAYKNRRPFSILREIDEMEATLFEIEVNPLFPYYEMKIRGIDDVEPPLKPDQKKASLNIPNQRSISSVRSGD